MAQLCFDYDAGRFNLSGKEVHCGDTLALLIDGQWKPCRIELTAQDEWYAVGYPALRLDGLQACWR